MDYYFAVFQPAKEGGYAVQFPDFPEAFTQGENFEDAMEMAKDILAITLEEYTKARRAFPRPSTLEDITKWAELHRDDEGLDTSRQFHIQAFSAPSIDMTPVRITVSFAKSVLDEIDAKAQQAGLPRSKFLAKAALEYTE